MNIFKVLGITESETRHSNMLAWLLNPKETHNLGCLFLKLFIDEIREHNIGNEFYHLLDSITIDDSYTIYREFDIKNGFIDILCQSGKRKTIIYIENKINSLEHSNQLVKYRKFINKIGTDYIKIPIFLTKNGLTPSDSNYVAIDYSIVYKAITKLLNTEICDDDVKILITHYKEVVKTFNKNNDYLFI